MALLEKVCHWGVGSEVSKLTYHSKVTLCFSCSRCKALSCSRCHVSLLVMDSYSGTKESLPFESCLGHDALSQE